jgi:hypothetical protein
MKENKKKKKCQGGMCRQESVIFAVVKAPNEMECGRVILLIKRHISPVG